MTPETLECISPPPRSSAVTISPVAAFTSGGPPRKMVPCSATITVSSRHRRDVRPAGRARTEHGGDLGDAPRRQLRLVVEDATEVLAVGEHVVPRGDEGTAGVDQVDARQPVLGSHLLGPQVLLHGDRVVRATLHRGVVGDDHAQAAGHRTDAGDDARARAPHRRTSRAPRAVTARGTASPGRAGRRPDRAAAVSRATRDDRARLGVHPHEQQPSRCANRRRGRRGRRRSSREQDRCDRDGWRAVGIP